MDFWKKTKTFLEWISLLKLVADLVVAIASWHFTRKAILYVPHISQDWASVLAWIIAATVMMLLVWRQTRHSQSVQSQTTTGVLIANTASETLPPGVNIDEFYRVAYRTSLEDEVQKNLRILAHQKQPTDIEGFYLKLIGVGLIQALYDSLWYPMFRSQLLALTEINRNSGVLPVTKVKQFYDRAAEEFPQEYTQNTFERWLRYLTNSQLILNHPSGMVEITVRGKDYLKYLTHWGREPRDKRL